MSSEASDDPEGEEYNCCNVLGCKHPVTATGKSVPVNVCLGSQQLVKLRELHLERTELTQDERDKLLKSFE